MHAVDARKLEWLVSAPKVSQVVIGQDGYPARIVVPDPRAFVIHKLWMCKQEDRDPRKKLRDRQQAVAVFEVVCEYLPQYKFNSSELRMFPKDVVALVDELMGS